MKRLAISLMLLFTSTVFAVYAPPAKDTVMCVGGGTKANSSATNGGGANKVVWDAGSPTDFIGTNGGPIIADTAVTYTNGTTTLSKVGVGTGVTVGTLVYISGTNITTGIYEVTGQTADTLVVANIDATGDNTDSVVNVGGSLDTMQNAIDDAMNTGVSYNRYIYVTDEVISATIDVDTNTADDNTKIVIQGVNSSLVNDGTKAVISTAADLVSGLVSVSNPSSKYQWRDIDFNASGAGKADYCVYNASTETSAALHTFFDCRFRGALDETGVWIEAHGWGLFGCEIDSSGDGVWSNASGSIIENCSIHDNTVGPGLKISSTNQRVINNIIYDNATEGITVDSGGNGSFFYGNTFFGNASHGILIAGWAEDCILINNTSCGNGTGGTGYGYSLGDREVALVFKNNHSVDGLGNANDNADGHCNLAITDEEFLVFLEGSNYVGAPLFTNITDGSEDFTPTTGSDLIDNAQQPTGSTTNDIGAIQEAAGSAGGQHSTKQGGKQ